MYYKKCAKNPSNAKIRKLPNSRDRVFRFRRQLQIVPDESVTKQHHKRNPANKFLS